MARPILDRLEPFLNLSLSVALILTFSQSVWAQDGSWKAGTGTRTITPQKSIWMAGYAMRDHPAEGTQHNLWVKALALEDSRGRRAVFVSTDLLGLPHGISRGISSKLNRTFQLERSRVMLTSSHTHSGPVLRNSLLDIYPLDEDQKEKIENYSSWLETRIVEAVGDALNNLQPARIFTGNGIMRFAVNRRNNSEPDITSASNLNGPIDHSLPVLKVEDFTGHILALVFGYACHATTLDGYEWSGDFPGFAQLELENRYPGTAALFFAGCGGDQNPLPRRSVSLAEQYGHEMADGVSRVLKEPMNQMEPFLSTTYQELQLPFSDLPGLEELRALEDSEVEYHKRWARRMLKEMESGRTIAASYPNYPVQTWQLGSQLWVALGGEVVVDYSVYLKRLLGQEVFITAYANDVMAYIPSLRVLREGGYEGATSMRVYGLPAPWGPEIELKILQEVYRQVGHLRLESEPR